MLLVKIAMDISNQVLTMVLWCHYPCLLRQQESLEGPSPLQSNHVSASTAAFLTLSCVVISFSSSDTNKDNECLFSEPVEESAVDGDNAMTVVVVDFLFKRGGRGGGVCLTSGDGSYCCCCCCCCC